MYEQTHTHIHIFSTVFSRCNADAYWRLVPYPSGQTAADNATIMAGIPINVAHGSLCQSYDVAKINTEN